jgi:hypothetical protein
VDEPRESAQVAGAKNGEFRWLAEFGGPGGQDSMLQEGIWSLALRG